MRKHAGKLLTAAASAVCALLLAVSAFADAPYWWKTERPFTNFTDENAPRVVDDADFLTDEEEAILSAKVSSICEKYDFSYVIFTDNDLHEDYTGEYRDYERENKYAADFLYFNGYGIGENYSATVLFHFSVDEDDGGVYRGWTTISIGDNEKIFTESRINEVDDIIEGYFIDGDYFGAYMRHAEYVEELLKDVKLVPDWYDGDDPASLDRSSAAYYSRLSSGADPYARHVFDNLGIIGQTEELENSIRKAVEKTGCDIVIFTDESAHGLGIDDYGRDFYHYAGRSRDGIILVVIRSDYGYGYTLSTVGFGKGVSTAASALDDRFVDELNDGKTWDKSLDYYVNTARKCLLHDGRMPMEGSTVAAIIIISLAVGLVFALIKNSSYKRGMKLFRQRYAARYLREGSLAIRNRQDAFLYRTVSRVAKPKDTGSSSSGSGGGRSSFGGGYSSGGGHYSGGGRHY